MNEAQIRLIQALLSETHEDVGRADFKASLLTSSLSVAFAGLVIFSTNGTLAVSGGAAVIWGIGVTAAGLASLLGGCAIWPRYRRAVPLAGPGPLEPIEPNPSRPQVIFWRHIAAVETVEDLRQALAVDEDGYVDRSVRELSRLSRTIRWKYLFVRLSICAGGVSFVALGAAAIISLNLR